MATNNSKLAKFSFFSSKEVEWNDFSLYMAGVRVGKVTGWEAGVRASKEYSYSEGELPDSIQSMNKEFPGKMTVKKSVVDRMWVAAQAAGGDDPTDISFDIIGCFRPAGSGESARPLSRISCVGCEISEVTFKMAQGAKDMEIELPFLALGIKPLPI